MRVENQFLRHSSGQCNSAGGTGASAQPTQPTQPAPIAQPTGGRHPGGPERARDARHAHEATAPVLQALQQALMGAFGGLKSRRKPGKKTRRGLRNAPGQMTAPNGTKIGGRRDVQTFMRAQDQLQAAKPKTLPAGQQPAPGAKALTFTPDEAARIRSAPTPEAAKQEVIKILAQRTGQPLSGDYAGTKGKGPLGGPEREALNQLLGTKIRSGREKNGTSAMILDQMAGSIAQSLRSRPDGAGQPAPEVSEGGRPSVSEGGAPRPADDDCEPPPAVIEEPVTIDISEYAGAADTAGELASPLIFDLQGQGLQIKKGERVAVDIDGDGKGEMITNLDNGLGLLVFDAIDSLDDDTEGAGRDYFGDRTDLTGYGIRSPRADGKWDNGFAALRALCESYEIVRGDKQHLDAQDLRFLESEVGLRMRIDGLFGEDRKFSEVGITRINLGDPTKIQSIQEASTDRFGNKMMRQKGATFIVGDRERPYADIWFSVTQRTRAGVSGSKPAATQPKPASAQRATV